MTDNNERYPKNSERHAIGWFCSYTPLEMIDAAGYVPIRISGTPKATGAADSIMHTNICPYIKSCLEAIEDKTYDFISAFAFTNGCDAQRRLYDVLKSRMSDIPMHLISIPKLCGPENIRIFSSELSGFKIWLEKLSENNISDESVRASIANYATLRSRIRRLDSMRRTDSPNLSGAHAFEITLDAQRMSAVDAIQLVDREEKKLSDTGIRCKPTILLAGNLIDDPHFVRRIENYGAHVSADDLCTSRRFWDLPEPDQHLKPIDAVAKLYLTKTPCPRMAGGPDPIDILKKLIENVRPDGVIVHIMKFCDTHLYNVPQIREMLRTTGVKFLLVEGDYTSGAGQMDTRMQAFIEML
jgi:benzoyl-CoA reductase/2-hydroxyglutaryl-CoA dehydratase subunit BcrC/BadD/HgdB